MNCELTTAALSAAYARGDFTPTTLVEEIWRRCEAHGDPALWIHRLSLDELKAHARRVEARGPATQPLYGVPFAIKDNIDLAGVPTTAACREFAYTPAESAEVVQRLLDAGAIPIGKTNLDQFATGLVGTRSPYGTPRNPFNPAYIPGGSSSGSAVAVAADLCSFSLGTDTAGSGRVPAAFNNLIGLKPTRGRLSTRGVVPACRTLDCVSIFARTAADAAAVFTTCDAAAVRTNIQ
ncbi:MAG TPA: amidase family protein, partial [Opitutaceae bacterium]|nr:amidase family protein [Opitutaceae bacterium]